MNGGIQPGVRVIRDPQPPDRVPMPTWAVLVALAMICATCVSCGWGLVYYLLHKATGL